MSGSTFNSPVMAPNGTRFGGYNFQSGDDRFRPVGDFDGDGRVEVFVSNVWGWGSCRCMLPSKAAERVLDKLLKDRKLGLHKFTVESVMPGNEERVKAARDGDNRFRRRRPQGRHCTVPVAQPRVLTRPPLC
ncbi:hypothetical protein [Rhodococcus koreensis]